MVQIEHLNVAAIDGVEFNIGVTGSSGDETDIVTANFVNATAGHDQNYYSTDGGSNATAGAASASVPGHYTVVSPYGNINNSQTILGAEDATTHGKPIVVAVVDMVNYTSSTSAQATDGVNVNPGAGWGGWGGWKSEEKDTKEVTTPPPCYAGWHNGWCPDDGETASSNAILQVGGLAATVQASDNITSFASDSDGPVQNVTGAYDLSTGLGDIYLTQYGTNASTSGANAQTAEQDTEIFGYGTVEGSYNITGEPETVTVDVKPISNATAALQNLTLSDWAYAISGSGSSLFNNGGWDQQGWGWNTTPPPSR